MTRPGRIALTTLAVVLGATLVLAGALWIVAGRLLRGGDRMFEFSPDLPGDLIPSTELTMDGAGMQDTRQLSRYSFAFRTNALGFRGLEVDVDSARVVMVLGDGYGFGTSVDGEHTLCDELNRLEEGKRPRTVCVNAAAPGMALADMFQYLREKGHRLKPAIVLVVMSWDDVWEMERPVVMRDIFRCMHTSRLCLLKAMYYRLVVGVFKMKDKVLDNSDRSEELMHRKLLAGFLELLAAVRDFAGGWGGRLVVLTEYVEYDTVRKGIAGLGIPLVVLKDRLGDRIEYAPDGHWAASTHLAAARLVAEWLAGEEGRSRDRGSVRTGANARDVRER
jgi:hypothetical protein